MDLFKEFTNQVFNAYRTVSSTSILKLVFLLTNRLCTLLIQNKKHVTNDSKRLIIKTDEIFLDNNKM